MNEMSEKNFSDAFDSLGDITLAVTPWLERLHNAAVQRAFEHDYKQTMEDVARIAYSIGRPRTISAQEHEAMLEYMRNRLQSAKDLRGFENAVDTEVKATKKTNRQDAFKNVVKTKKWGVVK